MVYVWITGQGEPPVEADVVLTSSLRNMQLLMNGKLSKVSAYLTGRLKVEGDKNAAYNLDKVITLVQQSWQHIITSFSTLCGIFSHFA